MMIWKIQIKIEIIKTLHKEAYERGKKPLKKGEN